MDKPNGIYVDFLIAFNVFNVVSFSLSIWYVVLNIVRYIDWLIGLLAAVRMGLHTISHNILVMLHQDDSEITELHHMLIWLSNQSLTSDSIGNSQQKLSPFPRVNRSLINLSMFNGIEAAFVGRKQSQF